jgi:hypothetical protein
MAFFQSRMLVHVADAHSLVAATRLAASVALALASPLRARSPKPGSVTRPVLRATPTTAAIPPMTRMTRPSRTATGIWRTVGGVEVVIYLRMLAQ